MRIKLKFQLIAKMFHRLIDTIALNNKLSGNKTLLRYSTSNPVPFTETRNFFNRLINVWQRKNFGNSIWFRFYIFLYNSRATRQRRNKKEKSDFWLMEKITLYLWVWLACMKRTKYFFYPETKAQEREEVSQNGWNPFSKTCRCRCSISDASMSFDFSTETAPKITSPGCWNKTV